MALAFQERRIAGIDWRGVVALCLLPVLLLVSCAGVGIYSRLKMASGRRKALALLASTAACCGIAA